MIYKNAHTVSKICTYPRPLVSVKLATKFQLCWQRAKSSNVLNDCLALIDVHIYVFKRHLLKLSSWN